MSTRPFFVVGSPRSGTALLRDLLRAHPRITLPGESHFIPLFYRAYGDPPQYSTETGLLREIFPDCQFIHIYRDGRDVALSILAAGFGSQNLYTAARQWSHFVKTARAAGAALTSGTYFDVRYEDLLTAPEKTMREVLAFLGEPFDARVLRPE